MTTTDGVPDRQPASGTTSNSPRPLTLALVNDYEIVVAGLAALLQPYADRVHTVDFDLDADAQKPVDIVVYDTFAARRTCSDAVSALLGHDQVGRVVAYSFTEDEAAVRDTIAVGVHGYISKAAPIGRVVHALERIAAGERVIELSQTSGASMVTAWPGKELDLTEREAEVMSLIAQGFSNDEIARLCYLSINTVKTYIRSAYRKAGVNTRAQAVAWALRHGFQPERTGRL